MLLATNGMMDSNMKHVNGKIRELRKNLVITLNARTVTGLCVAANRHKEKGVC